MKICLICKGQIEAQPPIMSLALNLKKLGYDVEIVTSYSSVKTKSYFTIYNVKIIDIFNFDEYKMSTVFGKIVHWKLFSSRAWKYIDINSKDSLLWIGTADTALALGKKLLKKKYVLEILELYDTLPVYRYLLAKYTRQAACVVVPEVCRAAIFRSWYSLDATPIVLPNKPDMHPGRPKIFVEDESARNILATIKDDEKIVLYQGHIAYDRDVSFVAQTVFRLGEGWRFVAMGSSHGDYLNQLKKKCPNFVHIPHVSPPLHLQITSHAYIGLISYSWNELNNVFCAPNKIWEYSGFGIPMICNDLISLQLSVQNNNSGLCVNVKSEHEIQNAVFKIDKNYNFFSKSAKSFFDSVDILRILEIVIYKANLKK